MVNYLSFSFIFLWFQVICLYSQNVNYIMTAGNNPDKEIENYMSASVNGRSYNLSSDVIRTADPKKIIRQAAKNIANTNAGVRYKMIDLVKRKALFLDAGELKQEYISFLTEAIKDKDSGNSGVASNSLTGFKTIDFNQQSRDTLFTLLTRNTYHYERIVKLNGFLKTEQARVYLKNRLDIDTTLNTKNKWAYHLALARMGDENSTAFCMDKVRSSPVNDNCVSYLYPDLIYTRQPLAVKYVVGQLKSDSKNCNAASPETDEKTTCAFKIMAMVAPVIKNFPVKADKYGDLETDNYNEALVTVRNWISTNPEYIIANEIY